MKRKFLLVAAALVIDSIGYSSAVFADVKEDSAASKNSSACVCYADDKTNFRQYSYFEALKYAPILWFANEEKYFPTLPFFSAFDGVNNDSGHVNSDTARDFADPDEIAPIDSASNDLSKASWDKLRNWYDALDRPSKKRLVTVFYRIRHTEANKVRDIFISDEQYWRRLGKKLKADSTLKQFLNSDNLITVYEYYFYYVRDEGLQGHPQDIERVFIFVPKHPSITFRIAVGAGHTDAVPNNVLVYNMKGEPGVSKENQEHLNILVELGGHSNAPDLRGNGLFDPVVDANWHPEYLWGTRDVQAIVGGGATGNYETWILPDMIH